MATKRDYYEILGVDRKADADTIKSAYRKLAMQNHPDKNKGNKEAEERFKEATEAYEILKEPDKRRQYDQFGHQAFGGAGHGAGGGQGFQDFDISDALRAFMNDFGGDSFFSEFFGGGGGRRRGGRGGGGQKAAGNDLQIRIALTLEEITAGASKKIKYKKMERCSVCSGSGGTGQETCRTCGGSGQVRRVAQSLFGQMVNVTVCNTCGGLGQTISNKCKTCGGEGRVRTETTVSVNIPAGVSEGNYIPLRGMGDAGPNGGPAGNLLVIIEEEQHKVFDRHGQDLVCELNISVVQAVAGDSVVLDTLDGKVKLTIAPGTQSESMLRLRDKGLPDVNNPRNRGDILVKVHVAIPEKLTGPEKELYAKLSEIEKNKPAGGTGFFKKARQWFE